MRTFILANVFAVAAAMPQMRGGAGASTGGSGPYSPAAYFSDDGLKTHTFYAPKTIPADSKLPVFAWAESGCFYNGRSAEGFLTEVASHGFFVIANGPPNGGTAPAGSGSLNEPEKTLLKPGLDFLVANAGKGKFAQVDASKVIAGGHSCGGLEAYAVAFDSRVTGLGIFSSGILDATKSAAWAKNVTKPLFYFLGGPSDVAYENGERDWLSLPSTTPAWKGNLPVGHGLTFQEKNGGKVGVGAVRLLQFVLQGNATSGKFFTGDGAKNDGWNATSQNLDKIKTASNLL